MTRPLLPALALVSVSLSACMGAQTYMDPNQYAPTSTTLSGQQALTFTGKGTLAGDIGPVKNLGAHPVTLSGFDDGTCTYVTIDGTGDNGHGTMIIDVMPRADEMSDGVHGIGADDETFEGTTVSSQASTEVGDVYNGYGDGGRVVMRHLPSGAREIEVTASYSDSATTSIGSFVLEPVR